MTANVDVTESAAIRECLAVAHSRELPTGILLPRVDNIWDPPQNPSRIEFANTSTSGPPILSMFVSLCYNPSVPETPFELMPCDRSIEADGSIFIDSCHLQGWSDPQYVTRRFKNPQIVATELWNIYNTLWTGIQIKGDPE